MLYLICPGAIHIVSPPAAHLLSKHLMFLGLLVTPHIIIVNNDGSSGHLHLTDSIKEMDKLFFFLFVLLKSILYVYFVNNTHSFYMVFAKSIRSKCQLCNVNRWTKLNCHLSSVFTRNILDLFLKELAKNCMK